MSGGTLGARDPWAPRPIDLPRSVPLAPEADLSELDGAKILAAPDDPADWPAWREALWRWRDGARARAGYDGSAYDDPAFAWTRSCFSVALVWLWDEQLYDWERNAFRPDAFAAAGERDLGGYDGVVLWHAYPVIGIDERNQFDWYRDVPGLADLVAALQGRGLRVFLDYNPWDTGTRREPVSDSAAMASLVRELGVDGVFLDTMKHALPGLRETIDESRPGVAFEGESTLPLERIVDHHLSWAQWFADSETPGVLRARWFERRHMLHHTRRWNRDHSAELRSAWLNGAGMLVWEVVFGSWVGWSARDRSLLRAMLAVQRRYADLLCEGAWRPLAARSLDGPWPSLVGSRFSDDGIALFTLANRTPIDVHDVELELGELPGDARLFDLVAGLELALDEVRLSVPRHGIGALVALAPERVDTGLEAFLDERRAAGGLVGDASHPARETWRCAPPEARAGGVPRGMVAVVARPTRARFRRRETGTYTEVPYVEEWKPLPPRLHDAVTVDRPAPAGPFAIDVREVTNAEFAGFVDATGYRPAVAYRFLAHWPEGRPLPDDLARAVTHVDLDDARAYAAWRGARLATEDEWQVAGEDELLERCEPRVWNLTESEHRDGRTRFVIVKGGAGHRAEGSDWYFDGGEQGPDFSAKLVLPGAGLARSAWIGFRCAVDLEQAPR
jgi:sulfatase modifying factor 1